MNRQEQQRGLVIAEVDRGALSVAEGARLLRVSVRQARRILTAYRQRGITALVHGNRGRVPTNAVDEETRRMVVTLATERYKGFNQVHLTEQLGEREGITLSRSSVRRTLATAAAEPLSPSGDARPDRCQYARLVGRTRATADAVRGD